MSASKYLYDPRKLRNLALQEFRRALRNDRMVAVTGAMADEALGYGDGKKLNEQAGQCALDIIEKLTDKVPNLAAQLQHRDALNYKATAKNIRHFVNTLKANEWDHEPRVSIRVIRDLLSRLPSYRKDGKTPLEMYDAKLAKRYLWRREKPSAGAIRPLFEGLGIRRFATLNYDHELERALMLRRDENLTIKGQEQQWPAATPSALKGFMGDQALDREILRKDTGRLTRMMGDGILVESDWVDREHPDRLLEFAIGSTEVDRHIMHLHGRADEPDSMIVDIADYDRLYRREDLNRTPFEHGMQVLLGGNPLLFVGLGMKETEINNQLQEFVSNSPHSRLGPAFLIWNTLGWTVTKKGEKFKKVSEKEIGRKMREMRIDFLVRLGVHVIFDRDLLAVREQKGSKYPKLDEWLRPSEGAEVGHHPELTSLHDLCAEFIAAKKANDDQRAKAVQLQALTTTLDALPGVVDYLGQFSPRPWRTSFDTLTDQTQRWRSINTRMKKRDPKSKAPLRMWGSPQLAACGCPEGQFKFKSFEVENADPVSGRSIVLGVGRAGSGRGQLAERIAQSPGIFNASRDNILGGVLQECEIADRLVVHAGFSYDADSTLAGIAQFLAARMQETNVRGILNENGEVKCRQKALASGALFEPRMPCFITINGIDRFFSIQGEPLSAEFDLLFRAIARHAESYNGDKQVHWLVLGTPRVRRYFDMIGAICIELKEDDLAADCDTADVSVSGEEHAGIPKDRAKKIKDRHLIPRPTAQSAYLEWVAEQFDKLERTVWHKNRKRFKGRKKADFDRAFRQVGPNEWATAKLTRAQEIDPDSVRRAFFAGYLAPTYLNKLGVFCPETFEVLRTMAFIGTPIEAVVLLFAPRVRKIIQDVDRTDPEVAGLAYEHSQEYAKLEGKIKKSGGGKSSFKEFARVDQMRLREVLEQLLRLGLIIQVAPEQEHLYELPNNPGEGVDALSNTDFFKLRFGLHRSIATELRERHGAPITEAKLSTSFNMSLFAAQPEERYTPEPRFHHELGQLVDRLIGAWKELDDHPSKKQDVRFWHEDVTTLSNEELIERIAEEDGEKGTKSHRDEFDRLLLNLSEIDRISALHSLSSFASTACLRAALAIVRGYYSTGNLLQSNGFDGAISDRERGALSEHAARLDRILRNFGNLSTARLLYRDIIEKICPGEENAEARQTMRRKMGAEPLYADDLVWLHNERGVLKLIQGSVYSARRSFSLAERANDEVEPGYRGHNWRRINMNLVGLMIERGRLPRAERRLDSIEATVNAPDWLVDKVSALHSTVAQATENSDIQDRVTQIRRKFGSDEGKSTATLDPKFTFEELLIVGLSTGYRGLIGQMRGEFSEAAENYRTATKILRRIGEMRAYGLFLRHLASMGSMVLPRQERLKMIDTAITAVDSVQQIDLSHRLRVLRGLISRSADDAELNRFALHDLRRALDYAIETDCFRVRVEAGAALARHMRLSGDYEAALRYASDALSIANRYGHALQKIWLRVEIGQIMLMRGSYDAGEALLKSAERAAIRTGYQRTIEHVQRARTQIMSTGRPIRRIQGSTIDPNA